MVRLAALDRSSLIPVADGTPETQINRIVSHPTMALLVTAHEDKFIRVFDLTTGIILFPLPFRVSHPCPPKVNAHKPLSRTSMVLLHYPLTPLDSRWHREVTIALCASGICWENGHAFRRYLRIGRKPEKGCWMWNSILFYLSLPVQVLTAS